METENREQMHENENDSDFESYEMPDTKSDKSSYSDSDFELFSKEPNLPVEQEIKLINSKSRDYKKKRKGKFTCDKCNKSFAKKEYLLRHKKIHTGIKSHSCEICDKSFSYKNELAYHQKSVHNIGGLETFPCDICDKEFYQRNKLNEHKRVHDGDTTCDLCNKVFYNVSTMRKHKERGSCFKRSGQQLNKLVKLNNDGEDEKIQACDLCPKTYNFNSELLQHKSRQHNIEGLVPKFPCDLCEKEFKRRGKLNEHMKTHTGETTCDLCNKVFFSANNLKKHKENLSCLRGIPQQKTKIEIKETPVRTDPNGTQSFECDICQRVIKHKENFARHMKRHNNERPFPCDICSMAFFENYELLSHKTRRHNFDGVATVFCQICNRKFVGQAFLNAHMKMHKRETTCDICGLVAYNLYGLKKHRKTHENKTPHNKTTDPPSEFYTNNPKKVKLYVCDVCNKGFISKPQYKQHIKTHSIAITLVQPTNDDCLILSEMIKEEPHSGENIEEYVIDSNMEPTFEIVDDDSKMVETADSNLAGNSDINSIFVDCGQDVKEEPTDEIEESNVLEEM